MKVLVDFPACFESDRVLPIQLGRVMVGNHVGRLIFCDDGKMRLILPIEAINDGSLIVMGEGGARILASTFEVQGCRPRD